ncbi:MAG: DNA glycosylase AlkZ-like family protein [Gaiellaceae bacterium]
MTLRELNRTLLLRQMLLERKRVTVVAAVARLVALQAQWSPSPYVALWSRVENFAKDSLTGALVDGSIVKAQTLRITLHVSTADNYPDLVAASMAARPGRIAPRVRAEPVGAWPHNKPSSTMRWWKPLPDPTGAALRIVRAYLAGYGPATRLDIQQLTGFRMRQIDPALDGLVERDGLYDVRRAPLASGKERAPVRFLPAFDSIILAHRDRSRIVPPEYLEAVFNKKNATTKNTFTVDGFVAGAWRIEKRRLVVEPFAPLPLKWRREVDAEGERLLTWYLAS